jgi:hypothetical protein
MLIIPCGWCIKSFHIYGKFCFPNLISLLALSLIELHLAHINAELGRVGFSLCRDEFDT